MLAGMVLSEQCIQVQSENEQNKTMKTYARMETTTEREKKN